MTNISVIIPTFNEQGAVSRAVESAWSAGATEVIVVDGGSVDQTTTLANSAGATVLETARGRAIQQNAGAKHSRGDYLLFLHADTWLDAACRAQLADATANSCLRIAAFAQRIDAPGRAYRWLEQGNKWRARFRGMAYGDQGITVRRDVFEQVGGFPEVPLMEDVRLMRQVKPFGPLQILAGPLHVSARRWQRNGVVVQTLRNQTLLIGERLGVPLATLARIYRPQATSAADA